MSKCPSCNATFCEKCKENQNKSINPFQCPICFFVCDTTERTNIDLIGNKRQRKKHKNGLHCDLNDDNILNIDLLNKKIPIKNNKTNNSFTASQCSVSSGSVLNKPSTTSVDQINTRQSKSSNKYNNNDYNNTLFTMSKPKVSKNKNVINNRSVNNINCHKCKIIQPISKVLTCSNKKCRESFCFSCLKKQIPSLTKDTFSYYTIHMWKCPHCSQNVSKSVNIKGDEFNVMNNKKYLHKLVNTAKYCEVFFSQKYGDTAVIDKKCFMCQNSNFSSNELLRFSSHRDLLQYLKYTFIYQTELMCYNAEAFEKNKQDIATYTKNVKIDYYRPWKFKYTKLVCKLCYLKMVNSPYLVNILESKFVDKIKQKKKRQLTSKPVQFYQSYIEEKEQNNYIQCEIQISEESHSPERILTDVQSKISISYERILSLINELIDISSQYTKHSIKKDDNSVECINKINIVVNKISDEKNKLNLYLEGNYFNNFSTINNLATSIMALPQTQRTKRILEINVLVTECNELYRTFQLMMQQVAILTYNFIMNVDALNKEREKRMQKDYV